MKNKILLFLMMVPALFSCFSCNKAQGGESVSKMMISFAGFRQTSGIMHPFILETGDEVALVHAASGERLTDSPVTTGGNMSLFLFNLQKAAEKDLLVGYYPASENINVQPSAVTFPFPAEQNGVDLQPLYLGATRNTGIAQNGNVLLLSQMACIVLGYVPQGDYAVVKAVLKGNREEGVAGTMTWNPESKKVTGGTLKSVTVTPAEPLDCSDGAQVLSVALPPVSFPAGFTITYTLSNGSTTEFVTNDPVEFTPGQLFNTDPTESNRRLLACGGGRVYLIDEKNAMAAGGDYTGGLIWTWIAREYASVIGHSIANDDHLSDAKPVNDGKNLLVTSSNGWAALIDIEEPGSATFGTVLWSAANGIANAHSADILPDGKIILAVSDGGDKVLLYEGKDKKERPIASYPLKSAHAVVWSESTERIYAIGGSTLQVYKRIGSSALELENTISTASYVSGLHDMMIVDDVMLVLAGKKAALFNMQTNKFTAIPHFSPFGAIKSLNYNSLTGETYYTVSGGQYAEGDFSWSTQTIRFTDDVFANDGGVEKRTIKVGDINIYKVRVLSW